MARAEQMQRAAGARSRAAVVQTTSTSRGGRTRPRWATIMLAVSVPAAAWAAVSLTGTGRLAYVYLYFFTEFYAGVVTLVSLSVTVMLGLLATDRLVLLVRHRVLLQSAHRAIGLVGVSGLVLHVLTKVSTGRAAGVDALLPFVSDSGLYVGFGTIAGLLMVSVLWTGLVRARFAGVGPRWLWRTLHGTAYVSWPFSMLHGLNAGRAPATWVVLSYLGCVLLVVVALLVRLSVSIGRRRREHTRARALDQAAASARPATESRLRTALASVARRRADAGRRPAGRAGGRRAARTAPVGGGWTRTPVTVGGWAAAPVAGPRSGRSGRFTVPVVPEAGSLSGSRPFSESPSFSGARPLSGAASFSGSGRAGRRRAEEPGAEHIDEALVGAEEPWDSPRRWTAGGVQRTGRHSATEETPKQAPDAVPDEVSDYWRPPARYVPEESPLPPDDTPTLVDLAARRARKEAGESRSGRREAGESRSGRREAGESRSARRRRSRADAVDSAYWAGLRGEAQ